MRDITKLLLILSLGSVYIPIVAYFDMKVFAVCGFGCYLRQNLWEYFLFSIGLIGGYFLRSKC